MSLGEPMTAPTFGQGQPGNAGVRLARWLLACAVRHWPEESRAWGAALAAEVDETRNAFDELRWSLGGIMFFARSVLSSAWTWLKLPAGSSLPGGPDGPSLAPKRSRLFTAVVLAVTAALLMLPEGREATRTVTASWTRYETNTTDQRTMDKLAARAEEQGDAQTLAFVALSTSSRGASPLVERTVAMDPSFIWVYGAKNHRHDVYPAQQEWVQRLEAADPGNAVPILIEADAFVDQKFSSLYSHNYPSEKDFQKLGDDPQWMALMARAYAAPRYDSYFAKHLQLIRKVWDRDPNLPPEMFLFGIWSHAMPDLRLLRLYAEFQLNEATKARAAGDFKQAEAIAGGVAAFGARMTDSASTVIEELIAIAISRMADKELAGIYTVEGKTVEAQKAIARGNELEQTVKTRFAHDEPGRVERSRTLHRDAALVQGFAILGGISLLAAVAGVLFFELWPGKKRGQKGLWRRVMCFAADYAPSTLLISCGAFLICFLPFQKVFADFRVSNFRPTDEMHLMDAMWGLMSVPEYVLGVDSAVAFWSALTITLSAAVVAIVVFSMYRARRTQTQAIR